MSSMLLVKLRRDLGVNVSRLMLMVIAIATALAGFGGVLFAWSASGRESTNAYMSTEPASATILLDEAVEADRMTAVAAEAAQRPRVLAATARSQYTSEVQVNGVSREIPLQIFVATAQDPMRMAKVFAAQASWPPADGQIFIGRDSLALLDVAVGDTVTIEDPSGQRRTLQVADTVYDPSLSPSPQEQTGRGYVSASSLPGPGGQLPLDQLKIQVVEPGAAVPSSDRDGIEEVARDAGRWLQAEHGLVIREIQVPEPYAHPHQWQADALLLSLLAGGTAALALSALLVANMLNTLFTQQIPQIGIMKALGADSRWVGLLYLAMTLLVAAAATALAVVPAVLLGRFAVANFLNFLGIQPQTLAPPGWTYVVVLGLGLALPPVMALLPMLRASRITVRAAIDHHGAGTGSSATSGRLARLGVLARLDRGLLMALRNTVRRPAQSFLSIGLLAVAGMVFVAGMSLSSGVKAIEEEQQAKRSWDVDVQLATPAPAAEVTAVADGVPGVDWVEAYTVTPTGVAAGGDIPVTWTYPDQGHGRIAVTAIPERSRTFQPATLLQGRWLKPGETGAVVLNQITVENAVPGVGAGDTVRLIIGGRPTTWRVVGLAEERQGGGGGVYVTADGLAQVTGGPRVTQLRIATGSHDEATRDDVAAAARAALTGAGFEVASAESVSRAEAVSAGHLGPVILILVGIAVPLGVVGMIGLAATMGANVLDRTREFGVMHAIGARPKAVRRIVVAEAVILAVTSCVVAALPALALTAVLGAGLGDLFFAAPLPYRLSLPAAGLWTAFALLGAVLVTDAAATRASRSTVQEAFTRA